MRLAPSPRAAGAAGWLVVAFLLLLAAGGVASRWLDARRAARVGLRLRRGGGGDAGMADERRRGRMGARPGRRSPVAVLRRPPPGIARAQRASAGRPGAGRGGDRALEDRTAAAAVAAPSRRLRRVCGGGHARPGASRPRG